MVQSEKIWAVLRCLATGRRTLISGSQLAEVLEALRIACSGEALGIYALTPKGWQRRFGSENLPQALPSSLPLTPDTLVSLGEREGRVLFGVSIPPSEKGPTYLLVCVFRDHRQAEEVRSPLLLAAELLFSLLPFSLSPFDSVAADDAVRPVLITTPEGRILSYNEAAQKFLGIGEEYKNRFVWELGGDRESERWLRHLAQAKETPFASPVRIRTGAKDQTLTATVSDLTDGRRAWLFSGPSPSLTRHEALARAFRIATLGELAAGITHAVNNPLQIILGNAELAMELAEGTVQERLNEILTAAERIREITRSVTRFADARRGQTPELIDLNAVVRETVQLVSYSLEREKVSIETDLAKDLPPILACRGDLEEVIMQLLRNAWEAIKESGVGSRIIVRTRSHDGWVRLEVEDDGPGIPPEQREHIFNPFVTTRLMKGGVGLGLSIVQNIVVACGGWIGIQDAPSGGALFVVELPTAQESADGGERGEG